MARKRSRSSLPRLVFCLLPSLLFGYGAAAEIPAPSSDRTEAVGGPHDDPSSGSGTWAESLELFASQFSSSASIVEDLDHSSRHSAPPTSHIAVLGRESTSVLYDPSEHSSSIPPARLTISGIGVEDAQVIEVGVGASGGIDVPGDSVVGWYRHGPAPGEPGSAVLAGHIAFDGEVGVFRRLIDTEIGDRIHIEMKDGTALSFKVSRIVRYQKDELPVDGIFARGGDPTLVLISCAGDFDRTLRTYRENLVVFAAPDA